MKHDETLLIGAHTSIAGGVFNALYEGRSIEATTIQMFTANQRQWKAKPISDADVEKWHSAVAETNMRKIMSHDSYLINLGSNNPELLEKSKTAFREEIERCLKLKLSYLNIHPGSCTGASVEECLDRIVASLLEVEHLFEKSELTLLLECTAGQGSSVGHCLEHLDYLIKRVEKKIPVGVCVDTCHAFVAGYDLRTKQAVDTFLTKFDDCVGLKYLYAFHFNDSMKGLGSKVDRHQDIGKGEIGLECFRVLMNDKRTRHLPKYLETPHGLETWKQEIALLKQIAHGE